MDINQILRAARRNCKYGAPMGAQNVFNGSPLRVQRVILEDVGYAPDGAYWGAGQPLYCGFNEGSKVYVRANSVPAAKFLIAQDYDAEFVDEFDFGDMVASYIEAGLWAEFDDPPPAPRVSEAERSKIRTACEDFITRCDAQGVPILTFLPAGNFGHCFYLARNGLGGGFRGEDVDQGLSEVCGNLARDMPPHCACLGPGGWVYFE